VEYLALLSLLEKRWTDWNGATPG